MRLDLSGMRHRRHLRHIPVVDDHLCRYALKHHASRSAGATRNPQSLRRRQRTGAHRHWNLGRCVSVVLDLDCHQPCPPPCSRSCRSLEELRWRCSNLASRGLDRPSHRRTTPGPASKFAQGPAETPSGRCPACRSGRPATPAATRRSPTIDRSIHNTAAALVR